MARRSSGFHTPFAKLSLPAGSAAAKAEPSVSPKPTPRPDPVAKAPPADEELFDEAMRTVAPLAIDPRGRLGSLGARLEIGRAARPSRARDEAEAYAELADLVDGEGSFDISSTDEYIEGVAPGLDKRLLRKLKCGDYAIQSHLDLHGLVQKEARAEVEAFLDGARSSGHRCVLIVHGRGLHSKDSVPVLKARLQVWLTRGPIARAVLAFATALPQDGGAGAVYVLLRR